MTARLQAPVGGICPDLELQRQLHHTGNAQQASKGGAWCARGGVVGTTVVWID